MYLGEKLLFSEEDGCHCLESVDIEGWVLLFPLVKADCDVVAFLEQRLGSLQEFHYRSSSGGVCKREREK